MIINNLFTFNVYLPNSNHTRIQIICHVDKLTLWHNERTHKGLRVGQFAHEGFQRGILSKKEKTYPQQACIRIKNEMTKCCASANTEKQ